MRHTRASKNVSRSRTPTALLVLQMIRPSPPRDGKRPHGHARSSADTIMYSTTMSSPKTTTASLLLHLFLYTSEDWSSLFVYRHLAFRRSRDRLFQALRGQDKGMERITSSQQMSTAQTPRKHDTCELVGEARVQRCFLSPAGLEILREQMMRGISVRTRRLDKKRRGSLNGERTNLVVLFQALPVLLELCVAVVPDLPYPNESSANRQRR